MSDAAILEATQIAWACLILFIVLIHPTQSEAPHG
jgi:hypothetical protein